MEDLDEDVEDLEVFVIDLDRRLQEVFEELKVNEFDRKIVKECLERLDKETRYHSIRTGLYGFYVCDELEGDVKYSCLGKLDLFLGGCLHDNGKKDINPGALHNEDFDEECMKQVRQHVFHGYGNLRGINPLYADIAGRHHMKQENSYPDEEEADKKMPICHLDEGIVEVYSEVIGIIDKWDASITRDNSRHGRRLSREEARDRLLKLRPEHDVLINALYECELE